MTSMNSTFDSDFLSFSSDLSDPATVAIYDELPLWSAKFGLLMLQHVPLKEKMKVLDVGCGTGFPLLELAQRLGPSSTVYGIDTWSAALDRARFKAEKMNIGNILLMNCCASNIPSPSGEFDLIVSNLGINNFPDPVAVLKECNRVLSPRGLLSLTTNLQGHMSEFYDAFRAVMYDLDQNVHLLEQHIQSRTTIEELEQMFSASGFRLNRLELDSTKMRFANAAALFNHYFVKLAFLEGWRNVVPEAARPTVFSALSKRFNDLAAHEKELSFTIPMAYLEVRKMEQNVEDWQER